jgi:hypothetical protein
MALAAAPGPMAHNIESGEPPGQWHGDGLAAARACKKNRPYTSMVGSSWSARGRERNRAEVVPHFASHRVAAMQA